MGASNSEREQGMPTEQAEILQKFMGQNPAGMPQMPRAMPTRMGSNQEDVNMGMAGGSQMPESPRGIRQRMPRPMFQRPQDEMPTKQGR